MCKYKVKSGAFEFVINEDSALLAGRLAIKLHHLSKHSTELGQLTMVTPLDDKSHPNGDSFYFCTDALE